MTRVGAQFHSGASGEGEKNPAATFTEAGLDAAGPIYLTQLSFKVVIRLNTGLPATLSTRSATK